MDDNFFTEKELKSANRGSIAPVVVVIFVIIALLGLAFFGGKYYLASRNNIKIFMNNYFNELEDNIGKNNSTSGSLSLNVNGDTADKEEKIFKILNNLDFSMNYGIDTKENITNIDISTNYYGDKLININTYIEDNNIYLSSSDLYSKYIKIENKKEDNSEKKSMHTEPPFRQYSGYQRKGLVVHVQTDSLRAVYRAHSHNDAHHIFLRAPGPAGA